MLLQRPSELATPHIPWLTQESLLLNKAITITPLSKMPQSVCGANTPLERDPVSSPQHPSRSQSSRSQAWTAVLKAAGCFWWMSLSSCRREQQACLPWSSAYFLPRLVAPHPWEMLGQPHKEVPEDLCSNWQCQVHTAVLVRGTGAREPG